MSILDSNDSSHSHSCNYEDYNFDCQLDIWGVDKLFQTPEEKKSDI